MQRLNTMPPPDMTNIGPLQRTTTTRVNALPKTIAASNVQPVLGVICAAQCLLMQGLLRTFPLANQRYFLNPQFLAYAMSRTV